MPNDFFLSFQYDPDRGAVSWSDLRPQEALSGQAHGANRVVQLQVKNQHVGLFV